MHTTKLKLLNAALVVAEREGYHSVKLSDVAIEAGVVNGTVVHHFLNLKVLKREVIKFAIAAKSYIVISQLITANDSHVKSISKQLRSEALNHVLKTNAAMDITQKQNADTSCSERGD